MADDIVGGFFALNGGAIGEDAGSIYYFAPDALCWQACGLSYSQFIEWALSAKIRAFLQIPTLAGLDYRGQAGHRGPGN